MTRKLARQPILSSDDLLDGFRKAEWHGNLTDMPGGSRYTHVSETLIEQIIVSMSRLETKIRAMESI